VHLFFLLLHGLLIYLSVGFHWIWGGGWLGKLGVKDFAGGITIHTSAGMEHLVQSSFG
jgi:Amt family ammonium transporter